MPTLGPDYGHFDLIAQDPRIWLGGPSRNCWRMYYNSSLAQWELEGGNGLVRYTMSSTFNPVGANFFDTLIFDHTLQAPAGITVYPLSPVPCTCPGILEPEYGVLPLTPYAPSIQSHLWPDMGELALTPLDPEISTGPPPIAPCDITGVPVDLYVHFVVPTGGCTCLNGFTVHLMNNGLGQWSPGGSQLPVTSPCGGTLGLLFLCQLGLWYMGMVHPFPVGCSTVLPCTAYDSITHTWTFEGPTQGTGCTCVGDLKIVLDTIP